MALSGFSLAFRAVPELAAATNAALTPTNSRVSLAMLGSRPPFSRVRETTSWLLNLARP